MRDFLIGIFIFLLLPNLYVDSVVYVAFKLQQDYIVKNLCVQKDEVINTCNGSCVLGARIKKANENQEDQNYPGKQKTRIFPVYIATINTTSSLFFLNSSESGFQRASIVPQETGCDIFHPPQV